MVTLVRSPFLLLAIMLLIPCLSGVHPAHGRPKNVEVAVRAKWEGTPILLEAGEVLAKDWKDLYWEFMEAWLREDGNFDANTAKDCVKIIAEHGQSFLDGPLARLFELSLTLRSSSPRLVLFRQLAEQSLSSFPIYVDETPETGTGAKGLDTLTVGVNPEAPGGECCWVDTSGALFFNVAELLVWLQGNAGTTAGDSFLPPELFDFDHVYPDWKVGSPVAILYGALGTDCFKDFHVTLVKAAKEGRVKYVVRPVLPSGCETKAGDCGAIGARDSLNLGGYGVELALKNMEYKAMDDTAIKKGITLEDPRTEDLSQEIRGFVFSKILERKPELISEIMAFRDNLLSSTISDTLDVWELKDLGHQTVQRIVHASDPLQSMQDISQNFPSTVSSLSRMKLDDSVKDEITANQRMIPPGKSLMALNGALINIYDVDLYLMVDWVQQELLLADQFSKLKVPHSTIRKLLSTLSPPESTMFRVDFRSEHVHYINNIEEDAMYKRWRSNINEILSPVFPGQLRYIRKNLFHTVYVVDPASACGLESVESLISYYENSFPMRFGLLLYSSKVTKKIELDGRDHLSFEKEAQAGEDISTLVIRLFIYVKETYGIQTAVRLLVNLNRLRKESTDLVGAAPEMHDVEEAFMETLLSKAETHPQDILLKLVKETTFQELAHEGSLFVFKLGLPKSGCCILMNGLVLDSTEEALINAMNDELPRIQEQVYYGQINSRTDVLDKFLSESGISRYNPQIIEGKGKPRFVSLSPMVLDGESFLNEISYLHSPGSEDDVKPVTHLLTVAITLKKGVKLLLEGIHYLIEGSKIARVGVLFSAQDPNLLDLLFLKAFDISVSLHSRRKNVLQFMEQLCLSYEQMQKLASSPSTEDAFIAKVYELASVYELPLSAYKSSLTYSAADEMRKDVSKVSQFLCGQLGIESGVNSIITNGRVTSLGEQGSILSHDLRLLEEVEYRQRVKNIVEVIEEVDWPEIDPDMITSKFISDTIMYVSSSISRRERSSESARFEMLNAEHSAVIVDNKNSSIHIDAVIDPLSPAGQKLAPLLLFFRKYIQPSMRIVLNPMSSLADLPLKNYYRYVFPTMDDFSSVDLTVNGPKAFFANMPLSKTLTMNLDVPEPWLIEPVIAVHDLDNILLENLGDTKTLQAVFELESLLLTGHCYEKDHDFPRGLQLILGTKSQPHLVDTLVMANLGYWQMKVFPGVLYLQLAPGRSSELYNLKEDADISRINPRSKRIIINDLHGKVVHLEVVKKSGMEHEKLLLPNDDNSHDKKGSHDTWKSNVLKWASGFVGGGGQSNKNEKKLMDPGKGGRHGKTINIFSIASGHLYERFLKIMILSVLKNTNRPVKFWFIKNYLSPQFKDVIPHMARDYGFEYELITYKWPTWLHKQKEKQRIIWAYKILFLDVIFPLSLEKVIFVDADQVVRADMGELYDMGINGRPLAYTPFCDNNKDMDGYRFWRQGFWKEHLRGRPYHISALYVVDLVKFRETAAGDNLRIIYESLSKDPNSLSNLDQDLPNYAQHTVPIFSLPQEWLWCESWCGNATKSKAKTIDLCNNPMTKEPKLQGARRIVSEWVELDSEARLFTAKLWGDEVDDNKKPVAADKQSQKSAGLVDEDLETKAEL